MPLCGPVLWDIKDTDSNRLYRYTGACQERILNNLEAAGRNGATVRLRCLLVSGINTEEAHIAGIADLYNRFSFISRSGFFALSSDGGSEIPGGGKCVRNSPNGSHFASNRPMGEGIIRPVENEAGGFMRSAKRIVKRPLSAVAADRGVALAIVF